MTTAKTGVMDVNRLPERSPRSTTRLGKGPMTYGKVKEEEARGSLSLSFARRIFCAYAKLFDPHSIE